MPIPCVWILLFAVACAAQDQQKPDPAAVAKEVLAQFAKEGIAFDGKAGSVSIPCEVNAPPDPIEYLLIHKRGKRHEAVFMTNTKPSVLNAALLMLGLQPGTNATYKEKVPPPTPDELEKGADPIVVTPPKGRPFWMTVSWKDQDGVQRAYAVEDLLVDLAVQKPVTQGEWIYLGGRMAKLYKNEPEVYLADFEGNLVSCCYLSPDNHLATLSHERARDDNNWFISDKVPQPGTQVTFTFWKDKPKLVADREAALLQAAKEAAKEPAKDAAKEPAPARK